jgi:hypothetical protein
VPSIYYLLAVVGGVVDYSLKLGLRPKTKVYEMLPTAVWQCCHIQTAPLSPIWLCAFGIYNTHLCENRRAPRVGVWRNTMKTVEVQNFVKNSIVDALGLTDRGTEIGRGVYAIPVETPENGTVYAKVSVTCTKFNATEKTVAFDLDEAVAKFEADEAEKVAKAEARKAEAEAKKAAKAKKSED